MESLKQKDKKKTAKISQLQGEKQVLQQEKKSAKSKVVKLEQKVDLQQQYQESQTRFETIFYKSKMGNKIIAPDLKIIRINQVFRTMLGYSETEIVGTEIIAFAHPDFIHHWHELQDNLWTKKIPSFQIETCLVRKDGSCFWCQFTSIIFRDNGVDLGYTIVEDISVRKSLEQELKKLSEYQETMVHMVAHDLKSPLNNIKSLSGFLKKNWEKRPAAARENHDDQSLTMLNMISDTCDKAYAIIGDLLLIGEFKSNLTLTKTDLKIFIESELPLLELAAQKKGIKINFHYPSTPVYAHIDEDKFIRILENLLSNAVKFTNTGGQVAISLKSKGQKVILQVSDTGIGIPEKLQPTIFNMFTNASRKGTQGETTTGLGLYIVEQIVRMHQGRIWLESQEDTGTSFFIELA